MICIVSFVKNNLSSLDLNHSKTFKLITHAKMCSISDIYRPHKKYDGRYCFHRRVSLILSTGEGWCLVRGEWCLVRGGGLSGQRGLSCQRGGVWPDGRVWSEKGTRSELPHPRPGIHTPSDQASTPHIWPGIHTPWLGIHPAPSLTKHPPLSDQTPPLTRQVMTPGIHPHPYGYAKLRSTGGRYAPYWNAILFCKISAGPSWQVGCKSTCPEAKFTDQGRADERTQGAHWNHQLF